MQFSLLLYFTLSLCVTHTSNFFYQILFSWNSVEKKKMLVWLQINIFKKKNTNFRIHFFSTEGLPILCLDGWVFGFLIQLLLPFTLTSVCVCGHWMASFVLEHNIQAMYFRGGGELPFKKITSVTVLLVGVFVCWQAAAVHLASSQQRLGLFHLQLQSGNYNFVSRTFFSFSHSHSAHQ